MDTALLQGGKTIGSLQLYDHRKLTISIGVCRDLLSQASIDFHLGMSICRIGIGKFLWVRNIVCMIESTSVKREEGGNFSCSIGVNHSRYKKTVQDHPKLRRHPMPSLLIEPGR